MKNPRLFALAIVFLVTGILGISVSTWFAGRWITDDRTVPMMDMMMGKGMMNKR